MNIIAITSAAWQLAGLSIMVVFAILLVLVLVLGIFSWMVNASAPKAKVVKPTYADKAKAKAFDQASEEDKAAVAVALYLYQQDEMSLESNVLTITHKSEAWSAELNPRL